MKKFTKSVPIYMCGTVYTVFDNLFELLKREYQIPKDDLKNWRIEAGINQRAFIASDKALKKFSKDLFEPNDRIHTFEDIVVWVDEKKKRIYVLDGGNRLAKTVFLTATLLCVAKKVDGEFDCSVLSNETVKSLEDFGLWFKPAIISRYEPKYKLAYESDHQDMTTLVNQAVKGELVNEKEAKGHPILELYNDEVGRLFKYMKGWVLGDHPKYRSLDDLLDIFFQKSSCSYLGIKDYTKSGLSQQAVYHDCSMYGKEHSQFEKFLGVLIASLTGVKGGTEVADSFRDIAKKFKFYKGDLYLRDREQRNIYFFDTMLRTYTPSCTKNSFADPNNIQIIDRPTINGFRTNLGIKNGSAVDYVMERINSPALVKNFSEYCDEMVKLLEDVCKEMKDVNALFIPSLNKHRWFQALGLSVIKYIWYLGHAIDNPSYTPDEEHPLFLPGGCYSDSKITDEIENTCKYICNALVNVLLAPANITVDSEMEQSIYTDWLEEMKQERICPSEAMRKVLHRWAYSDSASNRTLWKSELIQEDLLNPNGDFYNSPNLKDAVRLMDYRRKVSYFKERSGLTLLSVGQTSTEHLICQDFCKGHEKFFPYMNCAGNLTILNKNANDAAGKKSIKEKLKNSDYRRFVTNDEEEGVYKGLQDVQEKELAPEMEATPEEIREAFAKACEEKEKYIHNMYWL